MSYMVVVLNRKTGKKALYSETGGPVVFDSPKEALAHMRNVYGDNPDLSFTVVSLQVES